MIFNSIFDPLEIDKERKVIIEEINMYRDNPMIFLSALFEQTVFGNHPLGWIISGSKPVIKRISHRQILEYRDKFYQSNNMVLTVAGNFDKAKVKFLTEKYFGREEKAEKAVFSKIKINQTNPRVQEAKDRLSRLKDQYSWLTAGLTMFLANIF